MKGGEEMRAFLQELCEDFAANGNFSGVCLLKRENELVFEKAYGFANRAFRVPNRADTRFDTASVTKIFTAAAVLQLAEQGRLGLSDRITALVDLSGTKIPEDVTIEQLLNHTSGIADDADEVAGESYAALFADSPNYVIRECRDFLKNFAWKEPVFPAGTAARYCNCSYVLLGMAVEAVSGENYRDYYRKHIFEPAGMTRTAFLSMEEVNENTAEGYENGTFYGIPEKYLLLPAPGHAGRRRLHHGRRSLPLCLRQCGKGEFWEEVTRTAYSGPTAPSPARNPAWGSRGFTPRTATGWNSSCCPAGKRPSVSARTA